MNIISFIQQKPDYIGANGTDEFLIKKCESDLCLCFADDYRNYLKAIGIACFDGRELTGISKSARLNVVDVTKELKKNNPNIPNDFYVIEEIGVDGLTIWQSSDGSIYNTIFDSNPIKIANSLTEYLM